MKSRLKLFFYLDIVVLLVIIAYKFYLFAFERNFDSLNIANIKKVQNIEKENFTFAVLGKVENSIDVFVNRMIPAINEDEEIDFAVLNGNSVLGGSEDKFRILNRNLNGLTIPVVVGIGEKEASDGGALRFYKHYGPFYFSFSVRDSYFIFLDTTGQTSEDWQREWLLNEMESSLKYRNTFVFMNRIPYQVGKPSVFERKPFIMDEEYRNFLTETFSKYNVNAVFSSGLGIFEERTMDGVAYYVSGGGGGGFVASKGTNSFHYLKVGVNGSDTNVELVELDRPFGAFLTKPLERIWIYVHSLFYTSMSNLLLFFCLLILIVILIYNKYKKGINYYGRFDDSREEEQEKESLNIAMFTNNYFPFIGGVPISIYRLAKGLRQKGHTVYLFAPKYPEEGWEDDSFTIRCKLLAYIRTNIFNYTIVNIFSPRIEKEFLKRDFDVIHVHHPFWMGKKGLVLGKKYGIPVVLTHHTRLDSYSHYVPFIKFIFKNILSHQMIKDFAQKCTAVFAPTETSKEYLSNIGVSRLMEVLPTGIEFENFKNVKGDEVRKEFVAKDEVLLCSVSRLSKEKNLEFLIDCMEYVKNHTDIPFRLILIGDGPERDEIEFRIKEARLRDTVLLIGNVPPHEVAKYYVASDVFVFASKSETQGMVLLEAMAGGCPVVAVSSSGIEDVVVNGYNGYKTVEDVEKWSKRILRLLKNKEEREEMSANAYQYAERFSLEAMAERASQVYKKAIKNHRIYKK